MSPSSARFALILLITLIPVPGFGQGEKDKTPTLAEAKAAFAKVDKALNATYAETKKSIPKWDFEDLLKDQRAWIEYRDARAMEAMAFDHRDVPKGKEKLSPHYWGWLKELTETRIIILKAWRGELDEKPWTGRYIDGHGGILELVEKDKQLFFTLQVVRGPTYHLGSISGTGKRNAEMGRFSDAVLADKDKLKNEGETWLGFESKRRWLRVSGTNTQYYHGARAYFDGRYFRVATLSAKETAEVLKAAKDPDWGPQ